MAAALLVAGCAEAGPVDAGSPGASATGSPSPSAAGTSAPGSSGTPSTSTPTNGGQGRPTNIAPIAPGEPIPVGPAQIDASAIPGGYTDRITLDLGGTGLTVTGTGSGCSTPTAELLGEDATSVSVQLVVTTTSDGTCSAMAELVPLTVQLAQPLSDRTVVLSEVHR